jgi:hypothetical protein
MTRSDELIALIVQFQKLIELADEGQVRDKLRLRLLDLLGELVSERASRRRLQADMAPPAA